MMWGVGRGLRGWCRREKEEVVEVAVVLNGQWDWVAWTGRRGAVGAWEWVRLAERWGLVAKTRASTGFLWC